MNLSTPREAKIDAKLPPELHSQNVSGKGAKAKKVTIPERGERTGEGEEGGAEDETEGKKEVEDKREGAERPVADHDDKEVFVSQLTDAGVRKRGRREREKEMIGGGGGGGVQKGEGTNACNITYSVKAGMHLMLSKCMLHSLCQST